MGKLFLGLDASTQSLSAIVIDYDNRSIVHNVSLNFDEALPHYKTQNGVLPNADPLIKHSPPMMWVEALDLVFQQMKDAGVALGDVLAISGSGQQHGSVYLNARGEAALTELDPNLSLAQNLRNVFSRPTSPIWMDSSTNKECGEIRRALGGIKAAAQLTGSDVFERFTGPQIRRFHKAEPERYDETVGIALVSSFMSSILAGRISPIDHGDGAGMNLMDIRKKAWAPDAMKATAPGLKKKIQSLAPSWEVLGSVSPYFAAKYGLNREARTVVWSGDNPCSVIGLGLVDESTAAISLGTSDTYFGLMCRCRVDIRGEGHVFCAPNGDYMTLICFKNGSLARERIRDEYGLDWDGFNKAISSTLPGNNGAILLPWFEAEIVPRVNAPGIHRFDLTADNVAGNCRAVVEAQMMSMRLHSKWMKVTPKQICATGGASNNETILQVMADVMNCTVSRVQVAKSAALGAALRAAHAWLLETGGKADWQKIIAGFTSPVCTQKIKPNAKAARVYDRLIEKYAKLEGETIQKINSN
jgi:xylulokinase